MDKQIKAHFGKAAKTPQEKKLLNTMVSADKKLDRLTGKGDKKRGK